MRLTVPRGLLALALLAAISRPGAATQLDLRIVAAASGEELAAGRVELGPGEEVRFVRKGVRLPGRGAAVDLIFGVSLESEGTDQVQVALHGIVRSPDAQSPIAWTSRSYALRRGEWASFTVAAGASGLSFAARLGGDPEEAAAGELRRVSLATRITVREAGPGASRVVETRRVRLRGPEATEVVLAAAGEAGAALLLRLRPLARSDQGAALDLGIETRGPAGDRTLRSERLDLGWDDLVALEGLSGPGGPLVIEIRPER